MDLCFEEYGSIEHLPDGRHVIVCHPLPQLQLSLRHHRFPVDDLLYRLHGEFRFRVVAPHYETHGEQIDIHAGGEDLVFPHHENEIAQSEAANGKEFARYWMHNAFLNIDNRKMSKSLGNFRTVREISEQYDLQVLRFFMLSAHYRSPLNFSADLMEASANGLERIVNAVDNLKHLMGAAQTEAMNEAENATFAQTEEFVKEFEAAMDDDFNTADAIAAIFDLVKFANTTASAESSKEYLKKLFDLIVKLGDVLGLILDKEEELLDADIEKLIEERQAARKAKDFARADAIRDELLAKGIILKDTREGVQWKKA